MRMLALLCATSGLLRSSDTGSIRRMDFANYSYPWRQANEWPSDLKWLSTSEPNHVTLVQGRWKEPLEIPDDVDFTPPFAGLTLEEVMYGDLTGDGRDDAVVVVRYDSGGTQYHYFVYIYEGDLRTPKLLAYFRSGDRANQGLYRVSISKGLLVIDLFDSDKQQGDCCSSGFVSHRFRWNGDAFVDSRPVERLPAPEWSRRQVSVFGIPYDQIKR